MGVNNAKFACVVIAISNAKFARDTKALIKIQSKYLKNFLLTKELYKINNNRKVTEMNL